MATTSTSIGQRMRSWFTARRQRAMRKQERRSRPQLHVLEDRTLPSTVPPIGDVFYIEMENHNLTQPSSVTSPQQLLGNPAAPYLNSLMTPGNPNAAQTSFASNYYNVEYNNPSAPPGGIHPSEPNYVWQEAGLAGPLNDADPYPNNIVNAPNLSALLQNAGIPWKSYQEDIDLTPPTGGSVNQPSTWPNANLSSTVAPQSQWTVPLKRFSGTSSAYTNPYNGSHQYDFAPKHDGTLFFTATNGGNDFSPSNPEAQYYAPLQQFQTDLANNTLAPYSLITPDQFNDMHSPLNTNFTYNGTTWTHNTDQEAIAIGDNFLSQFVPQIMASQAYKNNGAIVIWFDETEHGNTTQFTIPEIVISPLAKGNAFNSTLPYTHSSDLKSLEELFGVSAPGGGFLGDANTPGTNDIFDFFLPPAGATVQGNTLYLVGGNTNDQLNITPSGSSPDGSTGISVSGKLNGVNINQTFTGINTIYVVGFNGNDNIQFAPSLTITTIVRTGDGNDKVQLGAGKNTVNVGVGNDNIKAGDGTNIVNAGAVGSTGNIQVQLGNGVGNTVTLFGDGNDHVQVGDGAGTTVSIIGNGNDHVQVGDGNNDSVSITGDGNDHIQVGNGMGDFVSMVGNGNDDLETGDGSGEAFVSGSGHKNIQFGSSGWLLI
jgi:hypothetical protein